MRNVHVESIFARIKLFLPGRRRRCRHQHTKHVLDYGIASSQYGAPGVPPSRCRCHLDDDFDEWLASVHVSFSMQLMKEMQKGNDASVSAIQSRSEKRRFGVGRLVVGIEPGCTRTLVTRPCLTGMIYTHNEF